MVFNDFVVERERLYRAGQHRDVTFSDTGRQVTTVAKQTPERAFLARVSAVPLQQAATDADRAYRNFFESLSGKRKGPRMGKPCLKRRGHRQTARFTKNSRFKVRTPAGSKWGFITLPGIGEIRFRLSRPLPSEPSSVTLILEADGTWWVSFVVKAELADPVFPDASSGSVVALDLGFKDLAHLIAVNPATGAVSRDKIGNPRYLRLQLRKLAREQRSLSRRQAGSANWHKQRRRVARLHRRVADQRRDHHHKLTNHLTQTFDTVCLETLSLRGMGRTRLSKSVYDAGLGTLCRLINDKAETQGRTVARAGRWDPTTQTCAVCGNRRVTKLPVSTRLWQCDSNQGCGTWLDRDYNAAVNVLVAAGLAETLNACGGDVRRQLAGADPETIPTDEETGIHRTDLERSPDTVQAA